MGGFENKKLNFKRFTPRYCTNFTSIYTKIYKFFVPELVVSIFLFPGLYHGLKMNKEKICIIIYTNLAPKVHLELNLFHGLVRDRYLLVYLYHAHFLKTKLKFVYPAKFCTQTSSTSRTSSGAWAQVFNRIRRALSFSQLYR